MRGLSQHELAVRAGLRREKVNRMESKGEDIGIEDLCRLLDAMGLQLIVSQKGEAKSPAGDLPSLMPQAFHEAAFIDGSKAKILSWGKVPK